MNTHDWLFFLAMVVGFVGPSALLIFRFALEHRINERRFAAIEANFKRVTKVLGNHKRMILKINPNVAEELEKEAEPLTKSPVDQARTIH